MTSLFLFKSKIMDDKQNYGFCLIKINRKMAAAERNILLFMDNAPCHPENFVVSFSNIKVVF